MEATQVETMKDWKCTEGTEEKLVQRENWGKELAAGTTEGGSTDEQVGGQIINVILNTLHLIFLWDM